MLSIASARSFPTESWRIFLVTWITSSRSGMVLAVTTSSSADFSMRSAAGLLKRPCVAKAKTRRAPNDLSSLAAAQSVPAVSIMSSTMMTSQSCTVPTRSVEPTSPALTRCLMMTARPGLQPMASSPSLKSFARATPPASGETTVRLDPPSTLDLKYCRAMVEAQRLSTGVRGPKKPWICPQWRSTQHTRSTPMASINLATSAAEIGTRERSLRSWRA
mmetsp:Transcript_15928/g.42891  ORF Transcript_15928/g.42891 Transcript_15928/m.42891 type:complete len:218 (-) Transcript_15928:975-1628(-)